MTLSPILMEWAKFVLHQDNIWQTLALEEVLNTADPLCASYRLLSVESYHDGRQKSSYFITIVYITTNVLPLCSVYQAPSYEANFARLAWFVPKLAYLIMLFILDLAGTSCNTGQHAGQHFQMIQHRCNWCWQAEARFGILNTIVPSTRQCVRN